MSYPAQLDWLRLGRLIAYRLLGFWFPTLLALANSVFWYYPERDTLMGWGDDPYFNLWLQEHHWLEFSKSGPLAFLRSGFWESNIFYPEPLTIALSDNQIAPGLLSWPFRLITGNGALSLSLLCISMNLAAYFCMAGWLRKLRVRRLAWWGGLAFSACGWVQTQSAHFQNVCIFVFPLALWMWSRFRSKMNLPRLLACALAFGWIISWNLYFQTFANIILFVLAAVTIARKRSQWRSVSALLVATVLVEYPFARHYLKLQSMMGDYAVGIDDFKLFAARLLSPFFHYFHRSWLQVNFKGIYPNLTDVTIESAGFIGYAWLTLWIVTLFARRSVRRWAWAAVAAFLVALGPDYYLFDLAAHFPGMSSLRAIGRAQIVSTLFSVAAIFVFLERCLAKGKRWGWLAPIPMVLLIAEQVPGRPRDFVQIHPEPWVSPATVKQIAEQGSPSLLVLPEPPSNFQLFAVNLPVRLYSGYSGRTPVQTGLTYQSAQKVGSPEQALRFLDFARPGLICAMNGQWREILERTSGIESLGCSLSDLGQLCLFRPSPQTQERWKGIPTLHLNRDATWTYKFEGIHVTGELRASRSGTLAIEQLGKCKLSECAKYPFMPEYCESHRLESWQFADHSYDSGQVILGWKSTRSTLDTPNWFRPTERFKIECQ